MLQRITVGVAPFCCVADDYIFRDVDELELADFDDIVEKIEQFFHKHSMTICVERLASEKTFKTFAKVLNVSVDFCTVGASLEFLIALINCATNQFVLDGVKIGLFYGDDHRVMNYQELEMMNYFNR